MTKVTALIFFCISASIILFTVFYNKSSSPLTLPTISLPTPPFTQKQQFAITYSIKGMRNRSYPAGTLKKEKLLYSLAHADIYRASYLSDGLTIYALLSIPKTQSTSTQLPVLILNHGYIDPQTYSTVDSYKKTFDYFADQPYIVIKPDYRGNGESEGDKNDLLNRLMYAVDIVNLIYSLPSVPQADQNRIALWGHSMGGDVVLRTMEITDKINGASLWAPVSADYPESALYFLRKRQPERVKKIQELIYKTFSDQELSEYSPSQNLQHVTVPLIIHHGTADESVPFEWSQNLDKKLTETKIIHHFYTYTNEDHNFTRGSRSNILKHDTDFFMTLFAH